jgi:hypothetical protein
LAETTKRFSRNKRLASARKARRCDLELTVFEEESLATQEIRLGRSQMTKHRVKEERLKRIRLGSRYVGFDLAQFYWECLKLAAASEELTESDILRRIIRSWCKTLPPAIQEKAQAETTRVETWKAQEVRAREDAKLPAKRAKMNTRRAKLQEKGLPEPLRVEESTTVG